MSEPGELRERFIEAAEALNDSLVLEGGQWVTDDMDAVHDFCNTLAEIADPRAETAQDAGGATRVALEDDLQEYKDALNDLVHCHSETEALTGGGPGIAERWRKAWAQAEELVRVEP